MSESRLTISGSTQSPNSIPREVTASIRGVSPSGQSDLVHVPVAQAGVVVAAAAEPAVVEHKSLHAEFGGGVGQLDQGGQVVVEVDRFPGVQHHGTGLAGARPAVAAGSTWWGRDRNQL